MICNSCGGKGTCSWSPTKKVVSDFSCSVCHGTGNIKVPWEDNKEPFENWYSRQKDKERILEDKIKTLTAKIKELESQN